MLIEAAGEVFEVDCLWRPQRVVVELDGRTAHDNEQRYEEDRRRDRRLSALGWHPVRVTSRHLDERTELRCDLERLLGGG